MRARGRLRLVPLLVRPLVFLLATSGWLALGAWRGGYVPAPATRVLLSCEPGEVEVRDGDTVRIRGEEMRFLGVDTPEKGAPWFDGSQEPWASRAADLVRRRIGRAERITVRWAGRRDRYGRCLVHVFADDEPLALLLVEAGLAYPTAAVFGDGDFPELTGRLLRSARPPPFEAPWRWRRAHRIEPPE